MIFLNPGDKLPTVAAVQALLNAHGADNLVVDADFGPKTEQAVKEFQRLTHCAAATGRIEDATWRRLNESVGFVVAETVDVCHPMLVETLDILKKFNQNIIAAGCMSNGVASVVSQIIDQNIPGTVVLLKFVGHGAGAIQAVGMGRGVAEIFGWKDEDIKKNMAKGLTAAENEISKQVHRYSTISGSKRALHLVKPFLVKLRPVFSAFGSIEFHGCHIALGQEGRDFLQEISDITGVPVSASPLGQPHDKPTRFKGTPLTGCPGGMDLQRWAKTLPAFNMSLA